MITVKILCGCGQKYAFDVEPYNGRMPAAVQCPVCKTDGTAAANEILTRTLPPVPLAANAPAPSLQPAPPPPTAAGLRINKPATTTDAAAEPAGHENGEYSSLLNRRIFFVKERAGLLKLTDTYDILDPASGRQVGIAKEVTPMWTTLLRFVIDKGKLPTKIDIFEDESHPPVASIHRGFTFLRSKINVSGPGGVSLGYFKSKLISLGGGFMVYDDKDQQVAEVKGNWKGREFRFLTKSGREIGTVSKKWAGIGKELFTTADNYVISFSDVSSAGDHAGALLLAAGLAIDIVLKEGD